LFLFVFSNSLIAQYTFEMVYTTECTTVKNQQRTATCWSFATASFLESELIRKGKGHHNLSEMFVVRNVYKDKARNYIFRQGKANFSQGSLAHDLLREITLSGIVPEEIYDGKAEGITVHNHREMAAGLKGFLDGVLKTKAPSNKWDDAVEVLLDTYMGPYPATFTYEGKEFTIESYTNSLGLDPEDYIHITSFTHHPFYKSFILEIPDNYSNGSFMNVTVDDLESITNFALKNGYSIAWDGDYSEKGFSQKYGIAVLPDPGSSSTKDLFSKPVKEKQVDQEYRQQLFENFSTTDDHLMHLTGLAKDQNGNIYYLIKNSWGETGEYEGYLFMSSAYFRAKTISLTLHKDAVPPGIF